MKLKYLLCLVLLSFTGCVGYNSTLFMTKSNVGLDIDTKPPTAEISVGRKEVAVAPTFEDGKTPPVMASFVTRSGFGGGFKNFFLGVSQTFSGGDAAVAMSMLYTNETPTNTDLTMYNSARPLTRAPINNAPGKSWLRRHLLGLPEPGHVRPFIFATDTSLGLKVAWSGTGGQFPDTVRAGFTRKEFAFAPVFYVPNSDTNIGGGTNQMPSFLATVDADIDGDTAGNVGSIQYFATGAAATQLTRQRTVREAMILRIDPRGPARAAEAAEMQRIRQFRATDVVTIDKKAALNNAHKDPARQQKIEDIVKDKTSKTWSELMRRGTAEEVEKAYDAARTAELLQPEGTR